MYDFSKALGDAVKKARREAGFTQKELSILLDMDYRTLQNIETYKGNPSMEKLYPLIRFLKIDPLKVFFPDSVHESPSLMRLRLAISDCSDDEADFLIPIILAALSSLRKKGIPPTPVTEE